MSDLHASLQQSMAASCRRAVAEAMTSMGGEEIPWPSPLLLSFLSFFLFCFVFVFFFFLLVSIFVFYSLLLCFIFICAEGGPRDEGGHPCPQLYFSQMNKGSLFACMYCTGSAQGSLFHGVSPAADRGFCWC